jgi:hypothetical protein
VEKQLWRKSLGLPSILHFHFNFQGAGAFGYFEVTHDITKYCAAKVFEKVGKRTVSLNHFQNTLRTFIN